MKKILLITCLSVSAFAVIAEESKTAELAKAEWKSIRHFEKNIEQFEEVVTYELKVVKYKKPIVFDWGVPSDMSGNNDALPEWHELLKRESPDYEGLSLKEMRALYTAKVWSAMAFDEAKFVSIKKQKAEFSSKYPEMRYKLVYAEIHVKLLGREFMYLLNVQAANPREGVSKIEERLSGKSKRGSAFFLAKVDGKWRHDRVSLVADKFKSILTQIPLGSTKASAIVKAEKSYFDSKDGLVSMQPFEK